MSSIPTVVGDKSRVDLKMKKLREKQSIINQGLNAVNN